MASSEGTKVTTDPQTFANPKNENPGVVTSDSLAAQSASQGGDFAANAATSGITSQTSAGTTTNTTDASAATQLDPAPDAEARDASQQWSESAQLNAPEAGKGPTYTTSGNSSAGSGVAAAGQGAPAPHGKSLTEGGIPADAPNASFTTDIGGENDPGRRALGNLQADNVPVAGGAGAPQKAISGDGQFDNLDESSA